MALNGERRKEKGLMNRGYNMGTRLIEDFLARTGLQRCSTFAETAEVISKVCTPFRLPVSDHLSATPPLVDSTSLKTWDHMRRS